MAMLTGYFDAAGDNSSDYAVTVGGYVSPVRNWSRFRRDWRKILDPLGIVDFHMTDFLAGTKDFRAWRDQPAQKAAILKGLANVIVRHAHYSPASTVLLNDWTSVNQDYELKECRATPYAIAAFSVLSKSVRWIGREHPHDHLQEFVYERGDTGQGDFSALLDWVREAAGDRLAEQVYPTFKPKSLEPLQAADFAAWEQRFVVSRRVQGFSDGFRESMGILLTLRNRNDWGLVAKPKLIEWCDWLGVPKRTSVKRPQKERAKWRPAPLRKRRASP